MKLGLVCSHGGHLTEMTELLPALAGHDLFLVTYDAPRPLPVARAYRFRNLGKRPLRHLGALVRAFAILRKERPAMLVSTGSEIAIPFFLAARLLGIKTIFIESVCRVATLSGTARLLYAGRAADEMYVQWPDLAARYPRARFEGGLL